jgi:hypothetical protein
MSGDSNLFICFFGDKGLWDNVILTAAYPVGFSYFRPFRYRDAWVQEKIINEIIDQANRDYFIGEEATLAMRFISDEHKWELLPIRKVYITGIDYLPDNQSIYFKMGPMIDFGGFKGGLQQNCLEIPTADREKMSGSELMFYSSASVPEEKFLTEDKEDASWVAYSDLIARDNSLPINEEAKNCIFLRFIPPSNKQSAKTEIIHQSKRMGYMYGTHLYEGQNYELVFLHRVPSLIGSHTTVGKVPIDYVARSGNIELSRTEEEYTHNYQTHVLTITAIRPTGTWEEIILRPKTPTVTADDKRTINTVNLHIPLKVNFSLWYRLRTSGILFILLWFALFVSAYLNPLLKENTTATILIGHAIASAVVAILIIVVKQRS